MLKIKNKNGEDVMKLTEDGHVEILSEELYLNGTKLEEDKGGVFIDKGIRADSVEINGDTVDADKDTDEG